MTISITTKELPSGVVGQDYQFQLQATVSPPSPLTWTCEYLPPHFTLDANTGTLSGLCEKKYQASLTFYVRSNTETTHKVLNLYIVPGWSSILLRNCLQDTGTIPRPATCPFMSPDIICTQNSQVPPSPSPQNYNNDPNLPLIPGQNNYFYIRAENLGTTTGAGRVYLYWCPSSLLLLPEQWTQNIIMPAFNFFDQTEGGKIAVTDTPFSWIPSTVPEGQQYSLICAASTATSPWSGSTIPSFSNWLSFVNWVNNSLNVGWRNVTLVTDPTQITWTRYDLLNYPFSEPTPMLLQVQVVGVPLNTAVTLKNDDLGINTTNTTKSQSQMIYSKGATCPPNFNGYIETTVQLPDGQTWPAGAQITTTLYFGYVPATPATILDHDFGLNADHPNVWHAKELIGAGEQGQLIPVGNCTSLYNPPST